MIKKFDTYNESIKDKLKGKSKEEIKASINLFIKDHKKELKENGTDNINIYDLLKKLNHVKGFNNDKEIAIFLMDEEYIDPSVLIDNTIENWRWGDNDALEEIIETLLNTIEDEIK